MVRSSRPLELWAGIECTRTRVADRRPDQLVRTGHFDRPDDLRLVADLGVPKVRYPVLWEHVVREPGGAPDWSWTDERLGLLRDLGVAPLAGLLHHGFGPGDLGCVDPAFPEKFAEYARAVAERYPWVTDYLPINEPLTTARFSGLYGVWYPHDRDLRTFARLLITQLRAAVLAMRAIRSVTPEATFTVNEDLGTILAVSALQDQAAFENERKWVTFDILTGRLQPGMRMWDLLRDAGISEAELRWFEEHGCTPDVLAVDHYLTSDRLLDDRMHRYPSRAHGGNGTICYADIEAVRAAAEEPPGLLPVLRETWQRYGLPMVIGEAHLGSTRDEQLRWLADAWRSAELVAAEGADIRAVTVWAVFGSYDWNSLLTEERGYYEAGPYDLRAGEPRPTALAEMVRSFATGAPYDHPALDTDGWWRKDTRLLVPPVRTPRSKYCRPRLPSVETKPARTIVLAGPPSPVLDAFERICVQRNLRVVTLPRERLAVEAPDILRRMNAWAIVDVAGCGALRDPRNKGARTAALARATREAGARLVLVTCHHALDGSNRRCVERESRRLELARSENPDVLALQPGTLLSPWDPQDPFVKSLGHRRTPEVAHEIVPSYLPDVVHVGLDLLMDRETGCWTLHHGVRCSRRDLEDALRLVEAGDDPLLTGLSSAPAGERFMPLPTLLDAVTRFVAESESLRQPVSEPVEIVEVGSGPGLRYPAAEPDETMTPADPDAMTTADGAA